jgi:hypothetical protein
MVEEEEVFDTNPIMGVTPQWVWEVPFFIGSYHLHPTALGVLHQRLNSGEQFSFKEIESEESLGHQALVSASAAVHGEALRIDRFWGLGLSEEFERYWQKYIDPSIRLPARR